MSDNNFGFGVPAGPIREDSAAPFMAYVPMGPDENDVAAVPVGVWLDSGGAVTVELQKDANLEYLKALFSVGRVSGVFFTEDHGPKEEPGIQKELTKLLNKYSAESPSGTPDYILAEFLIETLKVFNTVVLKRALWRGETTALNEENGPGVERIKI